MKTQLVLRKAEGMLADRLEQLQNLVQAGETALWSDLLQVTATLTFVHHALSPENSGALLTTAEMAERMGIKAKTLLRHKHDGTIKPAVAKGKLVRWSGSERLG